jgi:hypothetical protein
MDVTKKYVQARKEHVNRIPFKMGAWDKPFQEPTSYYREHMVTSAVWSLHASVYNFAECVTR